MHIIPMPMEKQHPNQPYPSPNAHRVSTFSLHLSNTYTFKILKLTHYDNKFPLFKNLPPNPNPNPNPRIDFDVIIEDASVQISHDRGSLEWEDIDFTLSRSQSSFQSSPLYIQMDKRNFDIYFTQPQVNVGRSKHKYRGVYTPISRCLSNDIW